MNCHVIGLDSERADKTELDLMMAIKTKYGSLMSSQTYFLHFFFELSKLHNNSREFYYFWEYF